jgi:hypothetical protein
LVGIEPASLTAVFCHNAADRSAASWHERLAPFTALEFATSDAAGGIASGLDRVVEQRRSAGQTTPLARGLDLFHTAREARSVLKKAWQKAEASWAKAEAADARLACSKRRGLDARGVAKAAAAAWRRAIRVLEDTGRQEAAWQRARAALDLFDAQGRLNDRTRATAEIATALTNLDGVEWKAVRNFLRDPRSTAFLDRMHEQLAEAEPRPEWRLAMAWRWWGRHRRAGRSADPRIELIQALAWDRRLGEAEQESYARVSVVLGGTVRASSAVECMNSVLRMQQTTHKRMTQAMLDLKRLYWNCHRLKSGKRKDGCPYQHLGLTLPSFDFWELLQADPGRLTQELSGQTRLSDLKQQQIACGAVF